MVATIILVLCIFVPLLVWDAYLTFKYDTQEDKEREARKTLEKLVKKNKKD